MSTEHRRVPVTGIHINLVEQSITFDATEGPVAKLSLTRSGLIFEAPGLTPAASSSPSLPLPVETSGSTSAAAEATTTESHGSAEKELTVVLSGRLKTKAKEGRPDGRGNPTAWARLAVHEEGEDKAHLYSATFHRHTAKIVLGLERDAPLTVEGYPHRSSDPKRLDTLSVINVVEYSGKLKPSAG